MSKTKVKEQFATSAIDDSKRPRKGRWVALDCRVLAVASEGYFGDWSAYIGAVAGLNHDKEWKDVLDHGAKLSEEVAKILFPDFAEKYTWRW